MLKIFCFQLSMGLEKVFILKMPLIVDIVSAIQSNMDKRLFTCRIFIAKRKPSIRLTIKFF